MTARFEQYRGGEQSREPLGRYLPSIYSTFSVDLGLKRESTKETTRALLPSGLVFDLITVIVKDIERSKEFYVKKLGFKLKTDTSEFASVLTPNKFPIGLHTPHKGHEHKSEAHGFQLEFEVNDVDAWYQRLRKRGVRFTQKPKDMPWREREAELKDPDGHILVVSSPVRNK